MERNLCTVLQDDGCFILNTGARMPGVGLGTWQSVNGDGKLAVFSALEAGYRHIDCAHLYGNELEVGEALTEAFAGAIPGLRREDVFITSKLWCTTTAPKRVLQACERSLKNLGVQYLDLFLMHWPVVTPLGDATDPPRKVSDERRQPGSVQATWLAMTELVEKGLVKAIGLSNFSVVQVQDILTYAKIKPAVNQVELHPYWRQEELVRYCTDNGIHVTAHTPLGIPGLSSDYGSGSEAGSPRPRSARTSSGRSSPALSDSSPSAALSGSFFRSKSKSVHGPMLRNQNVADIAKRLNKTPAQVILRWALQRGVSVLPRSVRPDRICSNLDILNWSLSEEDWQMVNSLEPQVRLIDGTHSYLSENSPFWTIDETDYTDDESHTSDDSSVELTGGSHRRRFSGALKEIGEDGEDHDGLHAAADPL